MSNDSKNQISSEEVESFYLDFVNAIIGAGYDLLGSGSFRDVYHRNNCVIKIPTSVDGVMDNIIEAKGYKFYFNSQTNFGGFLAPCKLLPNGALIMRLVQRIYDNPPQWAYEIDGVQVGTYKDKVLAYDYALDLKERDDWENNMILKSDFFQNDWK